MNLETEVMGLKLANPIIIASSSITNSVENIITCEKYGAGAVVLRSLYEEQIFSDHGKNHTALGWYPEAVDYVQNHGSQESLEDYLQLIRQSKASVDIPVLASINCCSPLEWTPSVKEIESAGADGIELNLFIMANDETSLANDIEAQYTAIVRAVKKETTLPVSVKLSPYFTNLHRTSYLLYESGVLALVLFSRNYRPDIDIDRLVMTSNDILSAPEEICLSLRWIGLLAKRKVPCDLIASTGVHNASAMIKELLAGATAVEICSALYENGISYTGEIISDLKEWMERKGFGHVDDFRGLIHQDPHNTNAWERIHCIKKTEGGIMALP